MNPIIKWPGGKSREISRIKSLIPEHDRYVEPFFGGGALFFHLAPKSAAINDLSGSLMNYYRLIKAQDKGLYDLLSCYCDSFENLISAVEQKNAELIHLFFRLKEGEIKSSELTEILSGVIRDMFGSIDAGFSQPLVLDKDEFYSVLSQSAQDKLTRTVKNYAKNPYSTEDLCDNLITGFTSGYYTYFRKVFNDINLGRVSVSVQYEAANFYFIREYCYGSMFRYNAEGEFNIPYGGMSYNRKDFRAKIENMFNGDVFRLFSGARLECSDFERFLRDIRLTERDFVFLDPPYDSEFSDYEGKSFSKDDQKRLAEFLKTTPAQFIMVIKNTEFIYELYSRHFRILNFDKKLTYNVRSRNKRDAEYLIITNLPE